MDDPLAAESAYRLDDLGWLQFERLCSLVLECGASVTGLEWLGHADEGRVALVDGPARLAERDLRTAGPWAVAVVWVRRADHRLSDLVAGVSSVGSVLGVLPDQVLVLTNLAGDEAQRELRRRFPEVKRFVVLGALELSESLDRHWGLRAAMPSVLGLRDLNPLIEGDALARSSLDMSGAQELARVFWPTRAYERARAVLGRHRFVVLTGPPEMGKTAIARMLALALMTDGWEAHECDRPEQVWRAFDRRRRQVFIADDAFGSTEYRADAADLWARELGRMLSVLDDDHWLIWTSRPAPLKAGLRRVQRERGSERFPAPGEVLVDATDLDLSEKTLILFRHAKNRRASGAARQVLRSAAVSIVEHPHFTPERIRRFVNDRLEALVHSGRGPERALRLVERELSEPTDAMRTSFRALSEEHRELLTALLDAPAGLIDERELAATLRRHHAGGLSRPPGELIDRLTDHFLRVTPLGIGWVHPSWRDVVIGELRENPSARRRFLGACGIYGAMLALSREGGVAGERTLPLLVDDGDWDALGDRLPQLLREVDDRELVRLLAALESALNADLEPDQTIEAQSLAEYLLGATHRAWSAHPRVIPVFVLEAWYALDAIVPHPAPSPPLGHTWTELHPPRRLLIEPLTLRVLEQVDQWLALVEVLVRYDPALQEFQFDHRDQELLGHLAVGLSHEVPPDARSVAESVLQRIKTLAPDYRHLVAKARIRLDQPTDDKDWWVPHDIGTPPTTEPVSHERSSFTREHVDRVLSDL
jgi:hypothetical protein